MSKSKSKGAKDSTKSQTDMLTKVKDAAVVKPAQTVKSKAKDIAKAVAGKEEKKSKQKKVKEPTPEPSDSEESESESPDSDSSADSASDSEPEVEFKPVANGKTNGAKKVAAAADSSDESDSSESSADEAPAKKTNGAKLPAAKAESESDEASDSDDSEDDSEEEKPKAVAAKASKVKAEKVTAKASSDEESDADSDDGEEDSDDSDDSDESEEEVKPKAAANKRKADAETVPAAKKAKTETNGSVPETGNLFVGNLSWNIDEDWLTREFETFGELSGVRIITDRETGRSKGFGYVEFVNAADAGKAHAAKAGSELDGRNINVDFAVKREQGAKPADRANDRRKSYGDSTSEPSDTLFCGNLSFDADQDTISQAFGEYGTVLGVRLPTDRETGAPKGFGYVTFSSVEEAGTAMESMNGAEIAGRSVRLDYSQPRPQNGDSPARGRGGFGGGRGGGRGGFGDRGGRGGGRGFGGGRGGGRGFGDRGGRGGGRGASTNRGGFGDFSGKKTTF